MDVFVARQPIFDSANEIVAYELLYRSGSDSAGATDCGDSATSDVIINSLVMIGLEKLTENQTVFINFTGPLIKNGAPKLLSPSQIVVELLETIEPERELLECLRSLKRAGYTIALDDYVDCYQHSEIVNCADMIKVDFLETTAAERARIAPNLLRLGKTLLAEKVETLQEFDEAKQLGFTLFQGYYLAKPQIVQGKDVRSFNLTYIQLLDELNNGEPNFDRIAEVVQQDVSLIYKLLRLINCTTFSHSNTITSVKHALVLLGLCDLRKWVILLMLRDAGESKPDVILKTCLLRASLAEKIADQIGLANRKQELFLMGLLSMIDVLVDQPLPTMVANLPLQDDLRAAMLGTENAIHQIFSLVLLYERGEWTALATACQHLKVNPAVLPRLYSEAVVWADCVFAGTTLR